MSRTEVVMTVLLAVIVASFYAISRAERFTALLRSPRLNRLLRGRLMKIDDELPRKLNVVSAALRQHVGLEAAACALLNLVFDMLTLALVFIAAGYPVSLSVLIAGYGVPLLKHTQGRETVSGR